MTVQVAIEIIATASDAVGSLRGLGGEVKKLDSSVKQNDSTLRTYTNTVIKLGAAYLSLRGSIGAVRELIGLSSEIAQQRTQLENLFRSATLGQQAFDWIQSVQAKMPGFTEAFIQLKSFGIDPLNGSMLALNDLAALLGGSQDTLRGIVLALGQAWAKQKLQGEEILQLVERGVPVWDLLAQATGRSVTELQELSQAGELGRDTISLLIREIGRFAQGAAATRIDTLSGQFDRLRSSARGFVDSIGQAGLLDAARRAVAGLASEFDRLGQGGVLDSVAKNISNALSTIISALGDVGRQLTRAFAEAAQSGALQTLADTLAGSLRLLGDAAAFVVRNMDTLARIGLRVAQAFLVIKIGGLISQFVILGGLALALSVALGALAVRGIALLIRGIASLLVSVPLLNTALTATAAAMTRLWLVSGAGIAVAIGLAIGMERQYRALQQMQREAERANRAQREYTNTQRELLTITRELESAGLSSLADSVRQIREAFQGGLISGDDARAEAAKILEAQRSIAQQIAQEQTRLADLQRRFAEQEAQQRQESIQKQIQSERERLQETQRNLSQAEQAERQYAQTIIQLRQSAAQAAISAEQQVAEIRRRGLSDAAAQRDIEREAANAFIQASYQVLLARQAQTDAEREQRLESAKASNERAQALANQIDSNRRAESVARSAARTQQQIAEIEIEAAQDAQEEQRKKAEAYRQSVAEIEANLDQLKKTLDELKEGVTVDVDIEIGDSLRNIQKLKDELVELAEQAKKTVKQLNQLNSLNPRAPASSTPSAPGFARGTILPGYGGGDRIHALLEAGEGVLRKEAVKYYGKAYIAAMNRMTAPRLPTVPQVSAPARFQQGGFAEAGATFNFSFPTGRTLQMRGQPSIARQLADEIASLTRARVSAV